MFCKRSRATLCFLAASLLVFARGAAAQSSNWAITFTSTGNAFHSGGLCKVQHVFFPAGTRDISGDAQIDLWSYPNSTTGAQDQAGANLDVTYTIKWVGAGSAPNYVIIKTSKTAWVGEVVSSTATPGSGFGSVQGSIGGDDADVSNSTPNTTVSHSRCVRLPVSNGQATYTSTMMINANSPTESGWNYRSSWVEVWVDDQITIDNRDVDISSDFDPTYYRGTDSNGNPIRVQNVRSPDGTMFGDTVEPLKDSTDTISYSASTSGSWSQNSDYYWYSSLTGDSDNNIFNPDPFDTLIVDYHNPPVTGGKTDHIYIHLIDGQDGADATNNYYMRFHAPVENWKKQSIVNHPLPVGGPPPNAADTAPDWSNLGDWKGGIREDNNSSQTASYSFALTGSITDSVSGTIGGGVSIGLTQDEINAAFQINENITIGESYTYSSTQAVSYPIPPYTSLYLFWSGGWNECSGICDIYGMDGYDGTAGWSSHEPIVMPGGVLGVSFAPSYYPIHQ